MKVYVVIKTGVYHQGVHLVASTREGAGAFVSDHSADEDGYHDWLIEEHTLDTVDPNVQLFPPHRLTTLSVEVVS